MNRSADVAEFNHAGETGSVMSSENTESAKPRPKRNPPRAAARDPWGEKELLTSDKSRLIDLDLVKLLAKPEAWNCLDEAEKQEILALLPDDVHPNPEPLADDNGDDAKIPPLPESFLRYSNNWRDGVRQFQLDLQNGRYDPEWVRQAGEAMEERAQGKFDTFKEKEFEEFWGQKQKIDWNVIAGESAKVKMETLIEAGVVQIGDVWKYSRVFGRKDDRTLVEKEARIVDIDDGKKLTFAVPPGQRVFLRHVQDVQMTDAQQTTETPEGEANGATTSQEESSPNADEVMLVDPSMKPHTKAEDGSNQLDRTEPGQGAGHSTSRNANPSRKASGSIAVEVNTSHPEAAENKPSAIVVESPKANGADLQDDKKAGQAPVDVVCDSTSELSSPPESPAPPAPAETAEEQVEEIIVPNIRGPTTLAVKILEIDGRRAKAKQANPWKETRCYRNNQDMGSLWEIRQEWYLRGKNTRLHC